MERLNNILAQFQPFIIENRFQNETEFNSFFKELKAEIEIQERVSTRSEILKALGNIRAACLESPFMERAQNWPRGYQGDFETVNYIIESKNKSKEGSFGFFVEDYFLNSDICQQHRNKIAYQAQLIKKIINGKRDAKIISIGCGTSEDIRICMQDIKFSSCEITLVDVDSDAIAFSMHQLSEIKDRIISVHGNIYKVMRNLREKYDLILIGGVFDYLNDKTIISILGSLKNNLVEKGILFFTNIDIQNPYRIFMEYLGNWMLIERSELNLISLINNANWPKNAYSIIKDKTGLTHLVELNYVENVPSMLRSTFFRTRQNY